MQEEKLDGILGGSGERHKLEEGASEDNMTNGETRHTQQGGRYDATDHGRTVLESNRKYDE